MTIRAPFKPHYGTNQVVAPAAGAASITLAKGDKTVRVRNTGAAIGYFRITPGDDTSVATVADEVVGPNETVYVEKPEDFTRMSHISATGTTFQVMTGEGGF